jgi:hypothetical protein
MAPVAIITRLKAEDLFDTLDREKEQGEDRRIEVRKNPNLERIVEDFDKISKKCYEINYSNMDYGPDSWFIKNACEYVHKFSGVFTSGEIKFFELIIPQVITLNIPQRFIELKWPQETLLGIYISHLMNISPDKSFRFNFIEGYKLRYLGYMNSGKEIFVKGNVDFLGAIMKKGKITINGNCDACLGVGISGGRILLNGHGGSYIAGSMSGGVIQINGNAGQLIGSGMEGGEIHLNGDYKSISKYIQSGNIYHKGKLIIKNGKAVAGAKIKWYEH